MLPGRVDVRNRKEERGVLRVKRVENGGGGKETGQKKNAKTARRCAFRLWKKLENQKRGGPWVWRKKKEQEGLRGAISTTRSAIPHAAKWCDDGLSGGTKKEKTSRDKNNILYLGARKRTVIRCRWRRHHSM